jgi:hypothetical protein
MTQVRHLFPKSGITVLANIGVLSEMLDQLMNSSSLRIFGNKCSLFMRGKNTAGALLLLSERKKNHNLKRQLVECLT